MKSYASRSGLDINDDGVIIPTQSDQCTACRRGQRSSHDSIDEVSTPTTTSSGKTIALYRTMDLTLSQMQELVCRVYAAERAVEREHRLTEIP